MFYCDRNGWECDTEIGPMTNSTPAKFRFQGPSLGTLAWVSLLFSLTACSDGETTPGASSGGSAGVGAGSSGGNVGKGGSAQATGGTSGCDPGAAGADADGGAPDGMDETITRDMVIYGCTSAGIIAAVQATQLGKTSIVVCPEAHLGGLSAGGLGWTDSGDKSVIGGLSLDFYQRIQQHYAGAGSTGAKWTFEPSAAEGVFEALVAEFQLEVKRNEWLDRDSGVVMEGARVSSITTLSGARYAGEVFIDATYEGDLMAAAGVSYHVGRESNATYGESMNGVQAARATSHQFAGKISPYVVAGDPTSGLLPRISAAPPGADGSADNRVQAYNYRVCLTNDPANRIPFAEPAGYDPKQYGLLLRTLLAGSQHVFGKFDAIPNQKTDTNNSGSFSTDNIGFNYAYPDASYEERDAILLEHATYQKGYFYFLTNDPAVPADVRTKMAAWGLPKDEFTDNAGWPHQIYVREARRMVSDFVMTEMHLRRTQPTPDTIGMGSYNMDSHHTQRYVVSDPQGDYVRNEGDIQVNPGGPYPISYRAIVPKKAEAENLIVPVCLSSSHIAYGSIRMEPVFMILGQSAATAASLAIDGGVAVQDIDYADLRARLLADGQVLGVGPEPEPLQGVVVDDSQAVLTGAWTASSSAQPFVGAGYRHDGDTGKGAKSARFVASLPLAGVYEVRLAYKTNANRATNVPVTIEHSAGTANLVVDQQAEPTVDQLFAVLGDFVFGTSAAVVISNAGTNGHVIIDAVQFVAK